MEIQIAIGISVVISLVLLRHFAARRVAAGQGQFVWLMFLPTMLIGVGMLWVSIQAFDRSPPVGVLIAAMAVIYLAVLVRLVRGMSRAVSSSASYEDLGTAVTAPLVDSMGTIVGLGLIAGVIALVVLIIWGVLKAAS